MTNFGQYLIVLTLLGVQCFAIPNYFIDYEDPEELASVIKREQPKTECIKDLLIVWDNSSSVGDNYNKMVTFVEKLLKTLVVKKDGTNIAIIMFSSEDRTAIKYRFGDSQKISDIMSAINDRNNKGFGGSTLTGRALDLAARQIFRKSNPKNHRDEYDDVLVLLTDGAPTDYSRADYDDGLYARYKIPRKSSKDKRQEGVLLVDELSNILKKRGIKIVAVAIERSQEDESSKKHLRENVAKWSDKSFSSSWKELEKVPTSIAAASCSDKGCVCPKDTRPIKGYVKQGGYIEMTFSKDTFPGKETNNCPVVAPAKKRYYAGTHNIVFSYGDVSCTLQFELIECDCSIDKQEKEVFVDPSDPKAKVTWTIPKPTCDATVRDKIIRPKVVPGDEFGLDSYDHVSYEYKFADFSITCRVDIKVKVIPCKGKDYDPKTHVCCCGVLSPKMPGGKCCGSAYYNPKKQKCCNDGFSNVAGLTGNCFGVTS